MSFLPFFKKCVLCLLLGILPFLRIGAQTLELSGFVPQLEQGRIYLLNPFSPPQDTVGRAEVRQNQFYLKTPWPAGQNRVALLSYLYQNDSTLVSGAAFAELNTPVHVQFADKWTDPPVFSGSENMKTITAFMQDIQHQYVLMGQAASLDSLNSIKARMSQQVYELVKKHSQDDLAEFSLSMLVSLFQRQLLSGEHLAFFYEVCRAQKANSPLAQYIEPILAKNQLLGKQAPKFPLHFEPNPPSFPNGQRTLLVFGPVGVGLV
ncbi:MAG: hypothetical protein OHK0053_32200 [Microscillaceae bacterium]